jgi:hypothetical protein
VVCTGGPLPATPVVCTFAGNLANTDVAAMTTTDSLTGGTDPTTAVVETVKGGNTRYYVAVDMAGGWTAVDLGGSDEGTRTYQLKYQYIYDPANAYGVRVLCQTNKAKAW